MSLPNDDLMAYMEDLERRHDEPVLLDMEEKARAGDFPIVGRVCGVILELLARAVGARRVFELGSGFGYSAYWFARAVGFDGRVHCSDGDAANAERAREYLGAAGLLDRVTFHVGDALEAFAAVEGDFDVVYCDVDKGGYPDCWRAARERIRPGGLWLCDNTLWSGRVTEAEPDAETAAIDAHNRLVAADARYLSVILPARDGVLAALRLGG
ncbi:MAG: O-methyltransferase [Thermoanaerobaculia bacterium]